MACRDAPSFEEYIRDWMYKTKTEASEEVFALARAGDSLSDAVAIALESLPARKSAGLRRLVELFEPWCEWKEDWEPKGWRIAKYTRGTVAATAPKDVFNEWAETAYDTNVLHPDFPDEEVVAAAEGVVSAKFARIEEMPYAIGSVYYLGRSL